MKPLEIHSALNIYANFPLHISQGSGCAYGEVSVSTMELGGPYLDYAVAITILKLGVIVLDFFPDGRPFRVRVGADISSAKTWSPSTNEQLFLEICKHDLSIAQDYSPINCLRDLVASKHGDFIAIPVIREN